MVELLKTVLFGAIGVRRKADHEAARIRPVHLIVAAILFVVGFILVLRTIVHFVTS
jgi:uncharacterized membrane protein YsdA (DUF1294 family)